MTRYPGPTDAQDLAIERQLVIELIGAAGESDLWGVYEPLHRIYYGDEWEDPGDSSADFCWLENLLSEMRRDGLLIETAHGWRLA